MARSPPSGAARARALCLKAAVVYEAGRLEEAIAHYRRALALDPGNAAAANDMGNALQTLGRFEDAISCYRAALAMNPDSAEIRINLGRALDSSGHPREALAAFGEALALAPESAEVHYRIGTVLENIPFLDDARAYYGKALALDPGHAAAHIALANVLDDLGFGDEAWEHRRKGYAGRAFTTRPALGGGRPVRVLKLISAAGGNVPLDAVLAPSQFEVGSLTVEFADRLPPTDGFDAVVNAIGDADRCRRGLEAAAALLRGGTAAIINPPARVLETGREAVSARLKSIPGVRTPRVVTLPRTLFEAGQGMAALAEAGWTCPLLLRALGHHAGHHFIKVDSFDRVNTAALSLPGNTITAIEWLDARGADGNFRKYRIMCLGGGLHPLHLAVSTRWKVHYYTANMADAAEYRAEELHFLSDVSAVVGPRGMTALYAIRDALGLDYGGLDFAVGKGGEILLFEANATMRIVLPPPDPLWDYRRPFIERALSAARDLFAPPPACARS
ncbi:MAG: tetratricopeptide repeat protein [Magnetospirillum sp.]|nr:tetratricopeptide repeat protein [Magnetospirillum sp.]